MSAAFTILVTGGAGYIGSHTCVQLLDDGYSVVVIDNLSNSSKESIKRVEQLSGKSLQFYEGDILDELFLERIFNDHAIDAVIHFAGLKAVGESVELPLAYYENNVAGTVTLMRVMHRHDVKRMVFSSSATVYGTPDRVPIIETAALRVTNPYGRTKLMIEDIMRDAAAADPLWSIALLRYFNPIGAHPSGQIGEDPNDTPNNIMPYITQVAIGRLPQLSIFGDDYPTEDGTGVRDYIHVMDLANGHLKALAYTFLHTGAEPFNLGTGSGYSVLQLLKAFETATTQSVPYQVVARRHGDIATCYADASKAERQLGWKAQLSIEDMCRDAWMWQSKNPVGYRQQTGPS
ncbi:UDP-glucose 4-epimerase GalE [Exiguobacterium sp. SH31]|uniref:UDP-glucose 4-epimerase GalE n=1 Tax=unclassified Exiguobacterium TaxID=2644629 RepID=UPI0008D19043|nr:MULTISPECIES: UDP-glucose 4-epimerase GalE [unclassified Exiguobacterium]OGX79705.1 UDP-glucose 4-epimerase GalE [Exiguobacterium sp. SH31]TCI71131.1 UDP-glucose 4-epimerase GalE [Exiguobacterium sp. SH0S7]